MTTNYEIDERDRRRFLSRVPHRPDGGCWQWCGTMFPTTGYGAFSVRGVNRGAHRVSYQMFVGDLEKDLVIDHVCRSRSCVNPRHLRQVTQRVNALENTSSPTAMAFAAGTCASGLHDMTDVYVKADGVRQCRPCQIQKSRDRRRVAGLKGNPQSQKTHCPAGHEYAGGNLYVAPGTGHRLCKTCQRANARARYQAKKR